MRGCRFSGNALSEAGFVAWRATVLAHFHLHFSVILANARAVTAVELRQQSWYAKAKWEGGK